MNAFSDEIRLALVLLMNGGVFAAAYRFARRFGAGGMIQAICDAFLLYFLVQYAAVALPGVVGLFTAWTMSLLALVAGAGLWIATDFSQWMGVIRGGIARRNSAAGAPTGGSAKTTAGEGTGGTAGT